MARQVLSTPHVFERDSIMRSQQGLSLIELLISLVLAVVLMAGVTQMFLASNQTYSTQQGLSRVQETGRLAMEIMARDIRMAGYMGCGASQFRRLESGTGYCRTPGTPGCITNGLNPSGNPMLNFAGPAVQGYSAAAGAAVVQGTPLAGTDVILVRSAGESSFNINQPTGNNANVRVTGAVSGDCLGDICGQDIILLSDCSKGRLFQITNLQQTGQNVLAVHSGGTPDGMTPGNISPTWPEQYDIGAEVFKVSTIAYYIADSGVTGRPSLWRQVANDAPQELLEGVTDMRLSYSTGGAFAASAPWDDVRAVRMELLVEGPEGNALADAQTLNFGGAEVTFNDGRLRQVFTQTVSIRSRMH